MPFFRIASLLLLSVVVFNSCSTSKNTFVARQYHNITARYNSYYYANENLAEGTYKIEKAYRDNYERLLPVFIYPTPEKAKATHAEFDKAIKKSSLTIQRHAIKDKKGNEIPTAGKWIDNSWINIGIAHFYKREFFSAIEAFEYVIRTYKKSNDKFMAMLWLVKAYNEIGSVSSAEPILSLLKNERNLPRAVKNELPAVWADYYIRRGMYTEAVARLMEATRNTHFFKGLPKQKRARYSFIVAQLAERQGDNKRAMQYYHRTIKLKPAYEMVFYSKIKTARLVDVKRQNSERTKKDLLKMAREFKNNEYYDVIYYTLGEIEEKEKDIPQALFYYKKSVQTSVINQNQKARSFLKLAEINFDRANYPDAGAYYDSTVATLPPDHPDYENIVARKKTLESLVGHIRTISYEDSLQRIAKMGEKERNEYLDRMIEELKKAEERRQQELEASKAAATMGSSTLTTGPGGAMPPSFGGNPNASFYFDNPTTVSFGVADFTRKWGNRKLEDNWRRSSKALVMEDYQEGGPDSLSTKSIAKDGGSVKTREEYLKDLPLNDTLLKKSDQRIIRSYYMMGTIYKEELHNNEKTISAFEDLNKRYPNNTYALNSYYSLYRTFESMGNKERAEFYRNKILTEFPDSEFALLLRNPDYAQELSAQKSEVEKFYGQVYDNYTIGNYALSYQGASEGMKKYGKNIYLPKFEFIRAMSLGRLKGIDSLEHSLKLLVARHPGADVTPRAKDILSSIAKTKAPAVLTPTATPKDTFNLNFDSQHFIMVIGPDDTKLIDGLKTNLGNFNTVYYSSKTFDISSTLFGSGKQMVLIKSFANAREAAAYQEHLLSDTDVYKGDVKKESLDIMTISAENLPLIYRTKNVAGYKTWQLDNYKNLGPKN